MHLSYILILHSEQHLSQLLGSLIRPMAEFWACGPKPPSPTANCTITHLTSAGSVDSISLLFNILSLVQQDLLQNTEWAFSPKN